MDSSSVGVGFMAVFAISGSVALLTHQIHKRVLSNFMKKFECEIVGSNKNLSKKKVRFADDLTQYLGDELHQKKHLPSSIAERMVDVIEFETMPLNRQVLYKGIIESNGLKGQYI